MGPVGRGGPPRCPRTAPPPRPRAGDGPAHRVAGDRHRPRPRPLAAGPVRRGPADRVQHRPAASSTGAPPWLLLPAPVQLARSTRVTSSSTPSPRWRCTGARSGESAGMASRGGSNAVHHGSVGVSVSTFGTVGPVVHIQRRPDRTRSLANGNSTRHRTEYLIHIPYMVTPTTPLEPVPSWRPPVHRRLPGGRAAGREPPQRRHMVRRAPGDRPRHHRRECPPLPRHLDRKPEHWD